MKEEKFPIYASFSDNYNHHLYIWLKDKGKFILEKNIKESEVPLRIDHWQEMLSLLYNNLVVTEDNAWTKQEYAVA